MPLLSASAGGSSSSDAGESSSSSSSSDDVKAYEIDEEDVTKQLDNPKTIFIWFNHYSYNLSVYRL